MKKILLTLLILLPMLSIGQLAFKEELIIHDINLHDINLHLEDIKTIEEIKKGNSNAFGKIYDKYYDEILLKKTKL